MENQALIKKADLALADLATAGALNPEQTDRFIRNLIDAPTLLRQVRTVAMNAPSFKINKIGFGQRVLRPAVEVTALAAADRSKPDLAQVQMDTKEVIAEVRIPYSVLEDNIEGGNVAAGMEQGAGGMHQTIVDLLAERAALDLEELAILGDTASADPYLALQDGFLKLATSNINDAAGVAISRPVIKQSVFAMPDRYLRNRVAMRHFYSVDNETELRDQYGDRETTMGDAQVQGNLPLFMHGSKVEPVALMPVEQGLFTDPRNLIFGIQRKVMIEYDKDIRTREFVIVLTARVAFQIEEELALVKTINVVAP